MFLAMACSYLAMSDSSAFNHLHIFMILIDAAISFAERERLFRMPRSTWEDYDPTLSLRGAWWPRDIKSIELSETAQNALGISHG